ncbi:MAG: hypothetical protein ACFFE4_23615 [Candidatus Thorarchaeota archaeon]
MKVIDMQVFYLLLVFKEGVLCTAAADKNDDAKITHKALTDIIDRFVEKFGDHLESWSGDVRIFRNFEEVIDEILNHGKVAEIQLKIPILKIFEKDFKKSQKSIAKKGLVLSEEDLREIKDVRPEWTSKRLPKQVISTGVLDSQEFDIAHLADGFHTISDIAEESGRPESEIEKIMNNLDKLELLSFVEIK